MCAKKITSRGSMSLAIRCNANSYCMLVIATHVMSCSNFCITYELLMKLQGQHYVAIFEHYI